jgi:hypothetical protein
MDHSQAAEHHLVEQYLLEELSPELRDEFEEHFFDCPECTVELRATSAYIDLARTELLKQETLAEKQPRPIPATPLKIMPREAMVWHPIVSLLALAACLLLAAILYQNLITLPRLRSEVATLSTPELLPTLSLAGGTSRSGTSPSIATGNAQSLLLQFDIPPSSSGEHESSYLCSIYSPEHQLLWTVSVPARNAKDTVSIRMPLRSTLSGTYLLEVKEHHDADAPAAENTIADYRFSLNAGSTGEGH